MERAAHQTQHRASWNHGRNQNSRHHGFQHQHRAGHFGRLRSVALFLLSCLWFTAIGSAGMITLIPTPSFPLGGNANALAGPLFSSDIDTHDIGSSGTGTASASKDGNSVTHSYSTKLDYGTTPGFFHSEFLPPAGSSAAGALERTATLDHRASAESFFLFTVDMPTSYSIMGRFEATDAAGTTTPGGVELELELLEFSALGHGSPPPIPLYYSYQKSVSTLDEMFEASGSGGDLTNELIGSSTGMLDPAKFYAYRTLVTINAIDVDGSGSLPATDGGASALGEHTMLFFGPTPVPEPNSMIVASMLALLGLVRCRHTRN